MKAILLLLAFAACAFAQTPTVTCASGTNRVQEGQSITCTSTSNVNWSLTGTGTLSARTSTTVTYTAPASVTVNHSMAGCPVMPPDSIFNTRIDNLPLNSNSATWLSGVVYGDPLATTYISFGGLGWGISTSNASTPTKNLVNYYGGSTSNFPIPSGFHLKMEEGNYHSKSDDEDHHVMDVGTDTCQFYELYNLHALTAPDGVDCNGFVPDYCNVQASVTYNWSGYTTNNGLSGTDAASLPLAPLTMHLSEFYNGAINHPLRFTSCLGCTQTGTFLWPAGSANGSSNTNAPPMGAWFRLRLCGVGGVSTNCATLSNYTAYQQIVLNALHYYGMILADIGSESSGAGTASDISLDRNVLSAVDSLGIPMEDFEVVDASSLQYAAGSYEVCPYNSTCVGAQNTYEAPANQAIITATPTGGGSAVSTSIAIQGVTVGLNSPVLWMEAGSYTYQIPSWVNGTSNQNVTWTLQSGAGSVTSGGIYTPPPGINEFATSSGAYELGMKFKSDQSGYIAGVRFYKTAGQTGTHTGTLWSCADQVTCSSGTQLATATFSETPSGWQDVQFGSPVAITANTVYVVSYHESDGAFNQAFGWFGSNPTDNAPLHALANGTVGTNGVFVSGSGGVFPSNSYLATNYWVDVDFEPTISGTISNLFTSATSPNSASNTAVLKATSAADSNATVYEYVYLLPTGFNPPGSIRIDSGNYGSGETLDSNSNRWQPEGGLEDASPGCCGGDFGWANWQTNPEIGVYETIGYGGGSNTDMLYSFVLPNGNYKVRAMFGAEGGNGGGASTSTSASGQTFRQHLETQGTIQLHNWNPFLNGPSGYAWETRVPTDAYIPAKVTNNVLQFANRAVFYDVDLINGFAGCFGCSNNTINGLEIIPDSTPAHWAIDTQQQSMVSAGGSLWVTNNLAAAYEIGTAFVPTVSGFITGVRFYKIAGDSGIHTGSLWVNNGGPFGYQQGTLLATGTFSGETASGWQTLLFSSPVAVTAGAQYVISYHTTTGMIYRAYNFFTKPLVQPFINGPLMAYMGMYTAGSGGAFPAGVDTDIFAVDPIFSLASNGSNPVMLFPTNGLPGQELQLYVQDWYTGINDPQWSIVSGPGTISGGTDLNGNPCGIYTAPWTQPQAGTAVVIQAQSQSNPSITAIATVRFSGTAYGAK